jgi:glycosyltransferase involved in cell wall biosynthesis
MEKQHIRLSFVVPIYNVEGFIDECLESILQHEGLVDYEVIMIDDGSSDDSALRAQRYSTEYPDSFKYIRQENSGVSVARNTGLCIAQGDYVLFLDADDRLSKSGLVRLLERAENGSLDIAQGNFSHFGDGYDAPFLNRGQVLLENLDGQAWLYKALRKRKFTGAPWLRIFRREFLLEKRLTFAEGIINAEDQLFTIQCYIDAKRVSSFDIPFYEYRHRPDSITNTLDAESTVRKAKSDLTVCEAFDTLRDRFERKAMEKLVMERCIKLLLRTFSMLNASGVPETAQSKLLERADKLQLHRYIRFTRFEYILDWFRLKRGFFVYLESKR